MPRPRFGQVSLWPAFVCALLQSRSSSCVIGGTITSAVGISGTDTTPGLSFCRSCLTFSSEIQRNLPSGSTCLRSLASCGGNPAMCAHQAIRRDVAVYDYSCTFTSVFYSKCMDAVEFNHFHHRDIAFLSSAIQSPLSRLRSSTTALAHHARIAQSNHNSRATCPITHPTTHTIPESDTGRPTHRESGEGVVTSFIAAFHVAS